MNEKIARQIAKMMRIAPKDVDAFIKALKSAETENLSIDDLDTEVTDQTVGGVVAVPKTGETGTPKTVKVKELVAFSPGEKLMIEHNTQKQGYELGKTAGTEMQAKELKTKYGITDDTKDLTKVVELVAAKVKADSGIAPDKKVVELEGTITKLQQDLVTERGNVTKLTGEKTQIASQAELDRVVDTAINGLTIDGKPEELGAKREMLRTMFLAKHKVEIENGKTKVTNSAGQVIADNLHNPKPLGDILNDFAPSYVSLVAPGGRGEGSSTTIVTGNLSGIKTKQDFDSYLQKNNIDANSEQALAAFREVATANPAIMTQL